MEKANLRFRSRRFSLTIIELLELLPKTYIYQIIGAQLLRAATSIGANIIEAQAGRTRRDFINFYHIALKSSHETKYWLEILYEKLKNTDLLNRLKLTITEVDEIGRMLTASLITLKGKRNY